MKRVNDVFSRIYSSINLDETEVKLNAGIVIALDVTLGTDNSFWQCYTKSIQT